MMSDEHISAKRTHTRRTWITWPRIILVVVVGLVVLSVWAWMRWEGEPAWYLDLDRELAVMPERERRMYAEDLEDAVIKAAQGYQIDPATGKVRRQSGGEGEPLRVADGEPQPLRWDWVAINNWLTYKLPEWREKGLWPVPPETTDFRAREHNGKLLLGFRFRGGGIDQIISAMLKVELDDQGRLRLDVQRVFAGELPMPWFLLRPMLVAAIEGIVTQPLPELIALLEGQWVKAKLDAEIGMERDVHLLGLDINPDAIELTISFHTPPSPGEADAQAGHAAAAEAATPGRAATGGGS